VKRSLFLIGMLVLVVPGCGGGGDKRGLRVVRFDVHSRLVGRTLHEVGIRAPAGRRPPLLVLLHGRSSPPSSFFGSGLAAALRGLGPAAPAVVLVDGGDHSYYHDRGDGRWGSYVLREAIPAAIRRLHADPRRVAIGGISMGGFGALDLARLAPRRFCAVGGHSAALWRSGSETPSGAFDDAADFGRHDVIAAAARSWPYGRARVWLDVGTNDPFRSADTELAALLRRRGPVVFHVWPGGHTGGYWRSHMRAYLRFYAAALQSCSSPIRRSR
jgi:S-formylglutathione hydrolase FrmB